MPGFRDITGHTFGRLTVIRIDGRKNHRIFWLCSCECGSTCIVQGGSLHSGKQRSCGCLRAETIRKHGHSYSRTYQVWANMRQRCSNPNLKNFRHYGGRGIKVCEQWEDFEVFLVDMGERPSDQHSLDRIDNDGNYCPENCQWATAIQQCNNTSFNVNVTHGGVTLTITEWSRKLGVPYSIMRRRLAEGWDFERVISTPAAPMTGRARNQRGQFIALDA